MKKVLILLAICLVVSCSSKVDLAIDNPTNEAVLISVDSLLVEVPARQVVWVEMGKGEHQIKLENDSVIKYNFTQNVYMVNPTLTKYLMYEEFYGNTIYQNMHKSSIPLKTVNYLGMEIEGNYEIVEDVINTVRWDYGPREVLPETVMIEDGDLYTILVKLTDPIELYESIPEEGE
ncbi:hypothetical protein [Ascidiimonas sp. W6]|uniref:hypothetical protein n=1 Tax=Ascidiimonas meishanensis TaxID=3128903 RepID=UPI0030EEA754